MNMLRTILATIVLLGLPVTIPARVAAFAEYASPDEQLICKDPNMREIERLLWTQIQRAQLRGVGHDMGAAFLNRDPRQDELDARLKLMQFTDMCRRAQEGK